MSTWQPIETAPPDGNRDVYCQTHSAQRSGVAIAYDDDTGEPLYLVWFCDEGCGVSSSVYWMPLPAAPDATP